MKRRRTLSFIPLFITLVLTSCRGDDITDPYARLEVNKTALSEGTGAFMDSIQIMSNVNWTLSGAPTNFILSAHAGQGNAKVYISGPANTQPASLSANLILSGDRGAKSITISLTQNGTAPSFTTDSTALSFAPGQGSVDSFMVISNVSWSISGLPSWVNANPLSGTGNTKVFITTTQANLGNAPLTATLTVNPGTAGGLQARNIILTQKNSTISGFTPTRLPSSDQTTPIVIQGVFDGTVIPVVKINGLQATVTSHTATSITVTLPSGATSGPVTVTQGTQTLTSAANFTVTSTWQLLQGAFNGLYNQSANFVLNGKIYMGLGTNATGYNNDFQIYDPQTGSWSQGPMIPAGMNMRSNATCFVLNNIAYIGFGSKSGTNLNDWWSFDGTSFTQMASFPGVYSDMGTAFVINNIAYVNAGNTPNLYTFDPATGAQGTWAQVNNNFPSYRYNSSFTIGTKGYVVAGLLNNQPSAAMHAYDPSTNTVSPVASVPTPSNNTPSSAATFTLNGAGYLYWNGTYRYDPSTDAWTNLNTNLTLGDAGAVINGIAYLWRTDGTMYRFIP